MYQLDVEASFAAAHDYLLVNWEGTLTDLPRMGLSQKHVVSTVESVLSLHNADRIVLSVANNHAADYGYAHFEKSVSQLESFGCN